MNRLKQILGATVVSALWGVALWQTAAGGSAQRDDPAVRFEACVERYFDAYFRHNPTAATLAGFHEHDHELENYSAEEVRTQIAMLEAFAEEVQSIDPRRLPPLVASDHQLLAHSIRAALLELQEIRGWQRNSDHYSSGITQSVFAIMARKFAPAPDRLRSVIDRERQVPEVFEAARRNLKDPPRIYTEVALEQLPGIIAFFEKDVPSAFRDVRDAALVAEFRATNLAVIDALGRYREFLEQDLLARSNGDFRIGADNFRKKLLYEEMVEIPLDRLLEIGDADLRANQESFRRTAQQLDPQRSAQQILADLAQDHPAPNELLDSVRGVLGDLRAFIGEHRIVTIPSPVPPIVEETPPFMRALTFASMDTPGPFESRAKEAYFNVTLPEPSWSKQQVEEHMAGFSRGTIVSTAIHEAYPGHYVQFLWLQRAPSKVRKLIGANSNAEGWAHYTEQMMLDEGYGNGDLKLRLGQLQDALLRNARFIVGIKMHTGEMTYEDAIEFFVREGYQSRANGERETKRGTSDPTYLVYTLGKLELLKLRDDYKKMRGDAFSLREFHDAVLKQGFPPIKLLRRALLGNDSPVL